MLEPHQIESYHRDGYVYYHSFLDQDVTEMLRETGKSDPALRDHALDREDGEGGNTRLALWSDANDDLLGYLARSDRMVGVAETLIGEEVYHFHSKMIQKEAHSGGAWAWHQDYGYWYNDTVLWPRLISCYIAIDPATRENGCLQVLKSSHHLGRLDHGPVGGQTGANPDRVAAAVDRLETEYCELNAGDALFFHCNLLHRSDQNRSPDPRWALICCYNAATNGPFGETWQPRYKALERVPHEALRELGRSLPATDRQFLTR